MSGRYFSSVFSLHESHTRAKGNPSASLIQYETNLCSPFWQGSALIPLSPPRNPCGLTPLDPRGLLRCPRPPRRSDRHNPLPDAFFIQAKSAEPEALEALKNSLQTLPGVEQALLNSEWAKMYCVNFLWVSWHNCIDYVRLM